MPRDPMDVVLLAYDGLCTFEFGTMVEIFGRCRPEFDPWYRMRVAGLERGPLRGNGGLVVEPEHSLKRLDGAGTILIPGWRSVDEPAPTALVRKLQRASDQGARILSVCTGAFVLADTGLLDGKRATTHWLYADRFRERFPKVDLDPDVLYVDEGNLITSAGSAAGIDMGLYLIRRDFGAGAANAVARRLVVPPHRDGGQKQFIGTPVDTHHEESFARILDDLRANLPGVHTVDSMADHASMSPRTFARRFKSATGLTPHRWLQRERVRVAQTLLETTSLTVDHVAKQAGFADPQLMRLHFKRVVGTAPLRYRRAFRASAGAGASS